jgi:arginyl-tRNA synthetase
MASEVSIAGPGFINVRLAPAWLAAQLSAAGGSDRLGVAPAKQPQTVIVDYSGPNIAKQMHVGHIRSTVLGDSLSRIHRFLGNEVVTDNHLGDWGTQFGKLLYGYKHFRDEAALAADPLAELERLYKAANDLAEKDDTVMEACRKELAMLQRGDSERLELWKKFTTVSWQAFTKIYDRLGVTFDEHLGESFYNDQLEEVITELKIKKIAEESEGAFCIFFPENKQLADKPFMIQKKDGAALYATTDLATLKYRIKRWNPDEIIYVTDGRQQLHFQQLFAAAERWLASTEWAASRRPKLSHVWFGSILGEDRKPIKTRTGDPIKLSDLLDESETRAQQLVNEKNPELPEQERKDIARAVGIGAIKYADLAQDRVRDYVFDWSKLLAFKGNTAPYLLYAYVRIESIYRKTRTQNPEPRTQNKIILEEEAEIELAKAILRFPEVVQAAAEDHRPHHLCFYLYGVAEKFSGFYENCPVLQSEGAVRASRLALCKKAAEVLKQGLYLLGIETVDRM